MTEVKELTNNENFMSNIIEKIELINEDISYLKSLFQRRLISDKQNERVIHTLTEYLDDRLKIDRGVYIENLFKELLYVIDYLESDITNKVNVSLAEQIVTIFQRRNLEIIDIKKLDNPIYYEVCDVEISEEISKPEIIEMVTKGYLLGGKVVRPAKVKMKKPK